MEHSVFSERRITMKSFTMKEFLSDAVNEVKGAVNQVKDDLSGELNETKMNRTEVADVAGDLTRLIMGDKKIAMRNLEKSLPLKSATFEPGKEYNDAFSALWRDIQKAIEKALKSAK